MGFFIFDPKELTDETLLKRVRLFRWIVFGGMGLLLLGFFILRSQGILVDDVRRLFFGLLFLLFPFTIPLNRLHKEYFSRKRNT